MFEVGIVAQFEAAHRLRGDFGPATRTHGHTYQVQVSGRGVRLREDGTLCDIALLERLAQQFVSGLHYRDLDELAVFEGRNTTAEVVAEHIARQIGSSLLRQGLDSIAVRVHESPRAYATYEAPLG